MNYREGEKKNIASTRDAMIQPQLQPNQTTGMRVPGTLRSVSRWEPRTSRCGSLSRSLVLSPLCHHLALMCTPVFHLHGDSGDGRGRGSPQAPRPCPTTTASVMAATTLQLPAAPTEVLQKDHVVTRAPENLPGPLQYNVKWPMQ